MIEVMTAYRGKLFTSFLTEKWFTEEKEYVKPWKIEPTKSEQASIDYIVKHYEIKKEDLLSKCGEKYLQIPRRHLCYLLKEKWRTLQRIWNIIWRHHSSIIYLLEKYDNNKNSKEVSWNETK